MARRGAWYDGACTCQNDHARLQFSITEILRGMPSQLYGPSQGFGRTSVSCVFVKPSAKESAETQMALTGSVASMLLDGCAECIGRLLSGIETAPSDLKFSFQPKWRPAKNE
jgi:hypothetical protein